MVDASFYRPLTPELCQGDIFERIPLVVVKEQPAPLKKITLAKKRQGFELGDLLPSAGPARTSGPLLVPAACDYTRAMLLSYACEIDKPDTKLLTLALVRPLDPNWSETDKAIVRENRKFAWFYLSPAQADAPESYVDFRRLSAVGVELLKAAPRLGRLSEPARKALLFQLFRHFARIDLRNAVLPVAAEEAE